MADRNKKSTARKSSSSSNVILTTSQKQQFEERRQEVAKLGAEAVEAQARAELSVFHGTQETHTALAEIYKWGRELESVGDRVLAELLKDRKYLAFDPAHPGQPVEKVVPFGAPAKDNRYIALAKLGLPGASPSFLSKSATVLHRAAKLMISEEGFPEWLAGDHQSPQGEHFGTGLTAAYKAERAERGSPPASPDKADAVGETEEPVVSEDLRARALKAATALEVKSWPVQEHSELRQDGFLVTLDYREGGTVSFVSVPVSNAMLSELLQIAAAQAVGGSEGIVVPAPLRTKGGA